MKNHIKVDGKLLQTNKKWSHLKSRQKEWIHGVAKEEYAAYVEKFGRLPIKSGKQIVVSKVDERICEREIWIPWPEIEVHVGKMIDRMNRKNSSIQDDDNSPESSNVEIVAPTEPLS